MKTLAVFYKIRNGMKKRADLKLLQIFALTGRAVAAGSSGYPRGEKHAVLVFMCQANDKADMSKCKTLLQSNGWTSIEISKIKKLHPESFEKSVADDPILVSAYRNARANGASIVIYSDPII